MRTHTIHYINTYRNIENNSGKTEKTTSGETDLCCQLSNFISIPGHFPDPSPVHVLPRLKAPWCLTEWQCGRE